MSKRKLHTVIDLTVEVEDKHDVLEPEEQPIGIAFSNGREESLYELVFEDDIYWGTFYRITTGPPDIHSAQTIEVRNNNRVMTMLDENLFFFSWETLLLIAHYVHYHY
jgi:hypothetical protein